MLVLTADRLLRLGALAALLFAQSSCFTLPSPHQQKWERHGLLVAFVANSSTRPAVYEIRDEEKIWQVRSPFFYDLQRIGVDRRKVADYGLQQVLISPDRRFIAIHEETGGEERANLLLERSGEVWKIKSVLPVPEFYRNGSLSTSAAISGVTNDSVEFDGIAVPFRNLRVYAQEEILPSEE